MKLNQAYESWTHAEGVGRHDSRCALWSQHGLQHTPSHKWVWLSFFSKGRTLSDPFIFTLRFEEEWRDMNNILTATAWLLFACLNIFLAFKNRKESQLFWLYIHTAFLQILLALSRYESWTHTEGVGGVSPHTSSRIVPRGRNDLGQLYGGYRRRPGGGGGND